mgnify:CR=1 FL=1
MKIKAVLFIAIVSIGCQSSKAVIEAPPVKRTNFIMKNNIDYYCPYSSLDDFHRNLYNKERENPNLEK